MADEFKTSTCGVDHVGLSVRDLASTRKFFLIVLDGGSSASGRIIQRCSYPMDTTL